MIIVPEREIAGLISASDCFNAVEQVFASIAKKSAYNFSGDPRGYRACRRALRFQVGL